MNHDDFVQYIYAHAHAVCMKNSVAVLRNADLAAKPLPLGFLQCGYPSFWSVNKYRLDKVWPRRFNRKA